MDYGTGSFTGAQTNGFGFPIMGYGGAGYGGPQRVVVMSGNGQPVVPVAGDVKPSNFRDGDWMCPSCGSHNYASRNSCRQCTGQKDSRDARDGGGGDKRGGRDGRGRGYSVSRSRSNSQDRGGKGGGRDRYQSDSRGGGGGSDNRGSHGRDNTCYAFQRGECNRGESCRFDHVRSGGGGGRDRYGNDSRGPHGRDNTCYAYQRGECKFGDSCRFDHIRSAGSGSRDRHAASDSRGGGRDNTCFAFQRGQCDRGESCRFEHVLSSRPEKTGMRAGDWWCGTCAVLKYAFREVCTTCNTKKDSAAEGKITAFLELKRVKNLPPKFLPGDWVCGSCSDHVFARKDKCGKCDFARPEGADADLSAIFGESYLQSRRKEVGGGDADE